MASLLCIQDDIDLKGRKVDELKFDRADQRHSPTAGKELD